MGRNNKLELTWVGKEDRPRLEPRILIEDPELSYAASTRTDGDLFDNRLIHGDNLLALKALEFEYEGKIKCVFIDPPYNTGSAFEHYDDGIEHSLWLGMMRERLEIMRNLLSVEGSIWITIDDNEAHYLKVLCDEVFGRRNFISNVIWQKKYSKQNDARYLSVSHDHVLVYAKSKDAWTPNEIERDEEQLKGYSNPDNDPRGPWTSVVYTCSKSRAERPNLFYPIINPISGREILPSETRVWGYDRARHQQHVEENKLWWGKNGEQEKPRLKVFLEAVGRGVVPDTLWLRDKVGDNQDAKREAMALVPHDPFSTPKPERLLRHVIQIATNPGDIVLDSFAGSGTTGAVAHKMRRQWLMVELRDHARTHIVQRMKKVIDGDDPNGITDAVGWKGGGGFRFDRLAPSLLVKDRWGNWVISKEYNPAMLAEAMCKHLGFAYAPSQDPLEYWRHGQSSERDFLFVTTHALTHDMLSAISYDVGPDRHLQICCKAFSSKQANKFENLTLVRIPQAILATCEWGRDDYSLRIANLPSVATESDEAVTEPTSQPQRAAKARGASGPTLFDPADNEA